MSAALHVLLLFHVLAKGKVYSSNYNLQLLYTVAREHDLWCGVFDAGASGTLPAPAILDPQ
jgi:hypothetical protein